MHSDPGDAALATSAEPAAATAPVLRDGAVILDAYRVTDVDAMQAGADPEIIRWINEGITSTVEQDRAAVARWETSRRTGGAQRTWAVRDRRTGDLTGGCELRLQSPSTASFSYWIYPHHRGRGLAARALTLIVDHAFTDLEVIRAELHIEVDNTASQRVALAAGFTREGVLRAVLEYLGDRVDAVSWSRLPTDPPPVIPDRTTDAPGQAGRAIRL